GTNLSQVQNTNITTFSPQPLGIAAVRDAPNNAVKLFISGTQKGTTQTYTGTNPTASTTTVFAIGALPDGTSPLTSGTVVQQVRYSRQALAAASHLNGSETKRTWQAYCGYPTTLPANNPSTVSGCKAWLSTFQDGGASLTHSFYDRIGPL